MSGSLRQERRLMRQIHYTFCELDNDNVTIIPASESLPLIFIDHVAYGSPLENPTPDSKCQNYYATSIDKVR